jgi:hypothetical protein
MTPNQRRAQDRRPLAVLDERERIRLGGRPVTASAHHYTHLRSIDGEVRFYCVDILHVALVETF